MHKLNFALIGDIAIEDSDRTRSICIEFVNVINHLEIKSNICEAVISENNILQLTFCIEQEVLPESTYTEIMSLLARLAPWCCKQALVQIHYNGDEHDFLLGPDQEDETRVASRKTLDTIRDLLPSLNLRDLEVLRDQLKSQGPQVAKRERLLLLC
jgi:hypothetical protein